jgi:hypothetical protein
MKGQKRRMSAGYPPARPNNWPGGQYTNPNGVPQGYASLSVNSGSERANVSGEKYAFSGRAGATEEGGQSDVMMVKSIRRGESCRAPSLPRAWG